MTLYLVSKRVNYKEARKLCQDQGKDIAVASNAIILNTMAKAAAELEQKEMSWRKERQIDENFEGWIFAGYSEDYEGGWFDEQLKKTSFGKIGRRH